MNLEARDQVLIAFHNLLLRMYPPGFRNIFEDEMQSVFSHTIREASDKGIFSLSKVFLLELRDLPAAAMKERLRELQSRSLSRAGHVQDPIEKLSHLEVLLALAVFLVPIGLVLLNTTSSPLLTRMIPPTLIALVLIGSIAGLIKRFPRWSLPYYGMVLSAIVFLFLFQGEAQRISALLSSKFVIQPIDELGRLLLVVFWDGMVWFTLLVLVAFSILILSRVPGFRPLVQRLWDDWTRLSYLLYGCSVLALVMTLDAYKYEAIFALIAIIFLAAGAWGYLQNNSQSNRFLALLSGLTLSMFVVWAGKWMLVPRLDWIVWFRADSPKSGQWFEPQQAVIGLAWMVIVIALPYLLRMFPRPHKPAL